MKRTTITSKKILTVRKSKNGDSLNLLSVAVLAGSMIIGTPAMADSDATIYNTDTIKVDNVDINGTSGDAVVNRGTITEITDSKFNNNSQNGLRNIKAVESDTANIGNISNSEFNNNANFGILSHNANIGDISNSVISGNSYSGLYMYAYNYGREDVYKIGSITNTTFENNGTHNQGKGSAIYLDSTGTIGDISHSKFLNNKGVSGGAIYVAAKDSSHNHTIGNFSDVTFEGNQATSAGGALYFEGEYGKTLTVGKFKDVTFRNNSANSGGGAIGSNSNVKFGNFENVLFEDNTTNGAGGVINTFNANNTSFGDFTNVTFKNNTANSVSGIVSSGATFGAWKDVSFINNKATNSNSNGGVLYFNGGSVKSWNGGAMQGAGSDYSVKDGGGIWASGTTFGDISNVKFSDLHATNSGGAIYNNYGSFGNLTNVGFENITAGNLGGAIQNLGNNGFKDWTNVYFNKVGIKTSPNIPKGAIGAGGVIYNNGNMGNWTNGYAYGLGADNVAREGGAIWNNGNIGNIINIEIKDYYAKNGGAVSNVGTLLDLTNDTFSNNHAIEGGGAINTVGTIGKISDSLFENNSAGIVGGAISNNGRINGIENTAFNKNTAGSGGGLYSSNSNIGILKDVVFTNNKAIGGNGQNGDGGAILVYGDANFEGANQFVNNSARTSGGAVFASGNISNLSNSNFANNTSGSTGGAIHAWGSVGSLDNVAFSNNKTSETPRDGATFSGGGAIFTTSSVGDINNSTFVGNEVKGMGTDTFNSGNGGAIFAYGNIGDISNSTFQNNKATNNGGAIWSTSEIGNIKNSNFINNSAKNGGALYSSTGFKEIQDSYFSGNKAGNMGGAIYSTGQIGTISNTSFVNNSAKSVGGAIYTTNDLNIESTNGYTTVYSGNTDMSGSNVIYLDRGDSAPKLTLNLNANTDGKFILNDSINGNKLYNLNLNGDKSGQFYINTGMKNADITQNNVTSYLNEGTTLNGNNSLSINSGVMNINHLGFAPVSLRSFANNGTINIDSVDINPATETMGRITANTYGTSNGTINVNNLNILADPTKATTNVLFADKSFANTVKYHGTDMYMGKIYKYSVGYLPDSGEFQFIRGAGSSGADAFNPSVLSTAVNSQAGTNATVNETFKYVFEHADAFSQLPSLDRFAMINENRYALSTDFNGNLGPSATEFNNKAGWFRPYATFEKMNLRNASAVNATTYGSLVGFDSDFQHFGKGWTGISTGYIGYNGSQLRYSGADTTMNGGLIGLTQSFYKGNFWTALTLSSGASVGESTTMYGKDNFTTLFAGLGSKTGYNFEFKQGRYIIQPIWFMSYTFAKTFDYTNAAGVRMDSDPMHSLQLNPSVRFIANTENGWQPYVSVGMVWNAMSISNVHANDVKLPEASIKPYIEYGIGVQKRFQDHFIAFGQAMVRNGGRNGVSLTAGFRWAIGHNHEKDRDKVSLPQPKLTFRFKGKAAEKMAGVTTGGIADKATVKGMDSAVEGKISANTTEQPARKIIKQLTPEQRISLGAKPQDSTRTTSLGSLKQM